MTSEDTVLIVDDDVVVRLTAAAILKRTGILANSVGSGEEALAFLAAGHLPSAILCDYFLPIMSGEEVVRQIRSHPSWKNIPVILLTGRASGAEWERAAVLCDATLTKPFRADDLTSLVNRLLGSEDEKVA